MADPEQINADQLAFWNGPGGHTWVARQEHTDITLAPMTEALLAFAAPRPGERVLDIRRAFIRLLGGAAVAWQLAARAQQTDRTRRIGMLVGIGADSPDAQVCYAEFRDGLRQLGWIDGRNVQIDVRYAAGDIALARKYAAELIALASDVLVSVGGLSIDSVASGKASPQA